MHFEIKTKGPIFDQSPSVSQKGTASARRIVQRLVEMGQSHLAQMLRKRPEGVYLADGGSTGNYRRNVKSEFIEGGLSALITDGGVVYGPWLEGVSSMNDRTRFKGYAAFRRTSDWLQEQDEVWVDGEAKRLAEDLGGR